MQHDDVEVASTDAGGDRGRARVPRGGDDDRAAFSSQFELGVHEPSDELQRDVLERQRRSVPQLLHPQVVVELHDRTHVAMVEGGIRLAQHVGFKTGDDGGDIHV